MHSRAIAVCLLGITLALGLAVVPESKSQFLRLRRQSPDVLAPRLDTGKYESESSAVFRKSTAGLPPYTCTTSVYVFTAEQPDDLFGFRCDGAGDVNNDGRADLIIGAMWHNGGLSNQGKAYVYSGMTGALLYSSLGGVAEGGYGSAVEGMGDMDHDNFDDFAIGQRGADSVHVYSGQSGMRVYSVSGVSMTNFGTAVKSLGDMNSDGFDEFIVASAGRSGAEGFSMLFDGEDGSEYGQFAGTAYSLAVGDIDNNDTADAVIGVSDALYEGNPPIAGAMKAYAIRFLFPGADIWTSDSIRGMESLPSTPSFGLSIAIGDFDGDEFDDIAVGDPTFVADTGKVYIVSGQTGLVTHTLVADIPGTSFGWSIATVDDLDGDSRDEILIGAPNEPDSGAAFLYSGATGTLLYVFPGIEAKYFGGSLANAGDVTGDGKDDVIICTNGTPVLGRCKVFSLDDPDADGIIDAADNCPGVGNPGQEDTDGNGTGDVCQEGYTPTGNGVFVDLHGEVNALFSNVTTAGVTSVEPGDCPSDPAGYVSLSSGPCFDVQTTAVFSGTVDLIIPYDPFYITGSESDLTVFHHDGVMWVNVEVAQDLIEHTITARVSSFSPFLLAQPSGCICDCHGDPAPTGACDSNQDILDVVETVNVAFRGAASVADPSPSCPLEATDYDCSESTDVIDVVKIVNVAFRGASVVAEFCSPCP